MRLEVVLPVPSRLDVDPKESSRLDPTNAGRAAAVVDRRNVQKRLQT